MTWDSLKSTRIDIKGSQVLCDTEAVDLIRVSHHTYGNNVMQKASHARAGGWISECKLNSLSRLINLAALGNRHYKIEKIDVHCTYRLETFSVDFCLAEVIDTFEPYLHLSRSSALTYLYA